MAGKTKVSIVEEGFLINNSPTYRGRTYQGKKIEGLLLNSRMVQAVFDDLNPETRGRWHYPDTDRWDPARNVNEFLAALPMYCEHGLLAVTINLQGGMPTPHTEREQPWHNSGWTAEGELRPEYQNRVERIIERADELGLVVILGLFYFGQDERLQDERAIRQAVTTAAEWILSRGYTNVLIEINNECDIYYEHAILQPPRVHELIELAKSITHDGRHLLVSTSYGGGTIPGENVLVASDFILLHGNGVEDPARIAAMVREVRRQNSYRPMPIVFNEDDHYRFDEETNNMLAAILEYASWGYYDQGTNNYQDGFQSPPINWRINTARKRAFFNLVRKVSGY